MSFNQPDPIEGHIYLRKSDSYAFKVLKVIIDSERIEYIAINDKNEEVGPKKKIDSSSWNNWNLKDLTNSNAQHSTSDSNENSDTNNKKADIYSFEFSEEGILSIKKDGKTIEHFNLRGAEGKPGRDGMPGQDGTPGKKGQDGIPGKPGPQGEQGVQGITGPFGKDGETWTPLITDDGNFLYFRNSKGDETNRFPIRGVKGDQGADGIQGKPGDVGPVFMPSISSDGNLSWSNNGKDLLNPTSVNIKGEQGIQGEKGITFYPSIKDGILYWINDKNADNPTPVRITGPQGIQGKIGPTGLSAYQIWINDGNWGTKKDFLESLKGEQGVPAPPANFSYEKVQDFTCPVQKINTKLITGYDDLYDNKTPDEIIDERIKKIEDIREQGGEFIKKDKEGGEYEGYRKDNWFKEAMWWCAGADRRLLRMCPGDHSKYVGLGTVIFFTALMAWFSSFIAMQLVFQDDQPYTNTFAAIFAAFWALMIFFLDRFITNTMYSDGKVTISKQEFLSGLPRILISIFLGIVISAPIELKIFNQEIKDEITLSRSAKLDNVAKKSYKFIRALNEKERKEREMNDAYHNLLNINQSNIKKKEVQKKDVFISYKTDTMVNGKKYDKPIYKTTSKDSMVDDVGRYNKEKSNAKKTYDSLTLNYNDALYNMDTVYNSVSNLIKTNLADKDSVGLLENLAALHAIAMKGYEPWFYAENNKILAALDTILHAWWWFLFNSSIGLIMFLFILIDVSPVLYRMMLADGKYDNYLHQEILLAQDKIRLSLAKVLKKLDESDLKRVAPFIMGNIYEKMADESFIFKTEEEYRKESEKTYNENKSWFQKLFHKKVSKVPAIIFTLKGKNDLENKLEAVNKELFEEVLKMKKNIIRASYRRWYKTQHDSIICDPVDDENAGKEPFEDSDDSK